MKPDQRQAVAGRGKGTALLLSARTPGHTERAAEMLRAGALVAFPTETVYGLGGLGFDERAVARIFEAKGRPRFDPLILHIASPRALGEVAVVNHMARLLAGRFWPGPLTLVLPATEAVPGIVTSGLPTVAVRCPRHPVAHRLLTLVGAPVAAPSANPFGRLSPTTARHVMAGLGGRIDAILDGGAASCGVESTIIDVSVETPVVLRVGAIPVADIESVVGAPLGRRTSSGRPAAPGQLASHYAPGVPLVVTDADAADPARVALVTLVRKPGDERYGAVEELSPSGDLREAAANLFAALHRLDEADVDLIVFRPVPEEGLGEAIMDRMRRAARRTRRGSLPGTGCA